jgi:protoporphyrinogen oxidase
MAERTAVIIGAGVAGLTTAYELLSKTDILPVVFEADGQVGGLAKTVRYKGNGMDIGPHRFFSKSDEVMQWWQQFLPVADASDDPAPDPEAVLLVCHRLTRILFAGRLYDYPISLDFQTLTRLGPLFVARMGLSYGKAKLFPVPERTLEDFLINRFGRVLFHRFFQGYTEKIWGVPCHQISPAWGAQRIKGLSVGKVIGHFFRNIVSADGKIAQKGTETSLIHQFLYPRLGAGQMWDRVAQAVVARGGRIRCHRRVIRLMGDGARLVAADVLNTASGETERVAGDYFVSSMPVVDLAAALGEVVPAEVRQIAEGLTYREHVMVALLATEMKPMRHAAMSAHPRRLPDHWIYVHDTRVRAGRLQIVNNWSPALLHDTDKVWLGLEYFCTRGDDLWSMPDRDIIRLAAEELSRLELVERRRVVDATVFRTPRAYPGYFGTYARFEVIRRFVGGFRNLLLVGRNGMHRYNNMDHSVLSGLTAVRSIITGDNGQASLWAINTEQDYQEVKT